MIFTNVSPATLEKLKAKLSTTNQASLSKSLTDSENSGHIMGHGVNLNYTYDPGAETLTVDVIHHPLFIPVGLIEHSVQESLNEFAPAAAAKESAPIAVPA